MRPTLNPLRPLMLLTAGLAACGGTPVATPPAMPAKPSSAPNAAVASSPASVPPEDAALPTTGCGEDVVALRFEGGRAAPTRHATLVEAFAALPSGAGVRICPGVHGAPETLQITDVRDVRIEGAGAVVLRADEGVALALHRVEGARIAGLTLARAWASGDDAPEAPALLEVNGGRGLRFERLTLDAAGSPAIEVRGAPDTRITSTTILDAATAFALPGATPGHVALTVSGGRVLRSRALVMPAEAATSLTFTPTAPPFEPGRGERPTTVLAPLPKAPPAVAVLNWPAVMARHRGAGLRIWQGSVYLVVAHTWGTPPGHPVSPAHEAGRPSPPLPAPKGTGADALPVRDRGNVHVFTPDGPCRATVGPPVYVDTLGCESGYMTAFALTGCGSEVAPIALVGPGPPALKYQPRTETRTTSGADALPPDARRAVVEHAFADGLLGDWARIAAAPDRAVVRHTVGTPTESLEALYVGFQYPVLECSIFKRTVVEAFAFGLDAPPRAVDLPMDLMAYRPFEGALLAGDRIAALIAADATSVALHGRTPEGAYPELFSAEVFTDNAECLGGSAPVDFEYPCAP